VDDGVGVDEGYLGFRMGSRHHGRCDFSAADKLAEYDYFYIVPEGFMFTWADTDLFIGLSGTRSILGSERANRHPPLAFLPGLKRRVYPSRRLL
jgi:hypothetical protein